MASCPTYTLSEIVDKYLINSFNDKRKYYKNYLIIAKDVWKKLFWNTLYTTQSEWIQVKKGPRYYYANVPKWSHRFIKVSVEDRRKFHNRQLNTFQRCDTLIPIYYNQSLNVIPEPIQKSTCGCGNNCSALCAPIDTWIVTATPIVINNVTYYDKTWLKYCPNGEVIEYREIPTKSYAEIGQDGDFNNDYNDDYGIGNAIGAYTVVIKKEERIICKLKTKKCGCPEDTKDNIRLFNERCGCHSPYWNHHQHKECYEFDQHINDNHHGEMKFSEDGAVLYFRNLPRGTKHVLFTGQIDPDSADGCIQIPDYCDDVMYAGIDYRSKVVNDRFNRNDKISAKYHFEDEVNLLIKFMNQINLLFLKNLQAARIKW